MKMKQKRLYRLIDKASFVERPSGIIHGQIVL